MLDRRKFFRFLGFGAAVVPVAQIQAMAPEAAVLEIQKRSQYLMVCQGINPAHAEELGRWLESIDLRNIRVIAAPRGVDIQFFRLDETCKPCI
jgi:hypothetical protein